MKISIVTGPWLPAPAIRGGSTNRIWCGFADEFAAAGHDVTVIARKYPEQPHSELIGGVRYKRVRGFEQTGVIAVDLFKDLLFAINTLSRLPAADITVLNDFWLPALLPLTKATTGKTVVIVGRYPKRQFWLYRGADLFVPLSSSVESALHTQAAWTTQRSAVIPYSFDPEIFYPPESLSHSKRDQIVLYVGRIHREKGLELLINSFRETAKAIPDATLQILGPHEEEYGGSGVQYLRHLQSISQDLNVGWLGSEFNPDRIAAIYRKARVFCYPSISERGETFGASALEAMACGCLTVVSGLQCFTDFVRADINGYIFDHRSHTAQAQLTAVLQQALDVNEQNARLIKQALIDSAHFSYAEVAKEYLRQFEALL